MQFLVGSTIEPRLAGARLALPPFMVPVTVFLRTILLGIVGAFFGAPALIAALNLCDEFPSGRRVAALLSRRAPTEEDEA